MSTDDPAGAPLTGLPGAAWREGAIASLLAAVLFLSFLAVPVLGPIALPFSPAPAVRTAHRRGLSAGLAVAAGAAVLIFLGTVATAGPAASAGGSLVVLMLVALPAAAAASVRRGISASSAYVALATVGFLLVSGSLLARSAATGQSPGREIAAAVNEMGPAAVDRAGLDPETAARMRATLAAARDFAETFWIGLAGACWVLGSAVAFYTGSRAARPAPSADAVRFEALRVPTAAVALFALAGAGSVLLSGRWRQVSGDLLIPLAALYFVLGLSIICHFARRWFRVRFLRVGLYTLVVYFPMNVAVALLGLFDWYADFRRRGEGALEKS